MKKRVSLLSLAMAAIAGGGVFLFTLSAVTASPKFAFERDTGGEYIGEVEPEIQGVYAHKFVTPDDSRYSTQKNYSMSNLGDIESVWDNYTGKGIKIAIIDDGFAYEHPEYIRHDGNSAIHEDSAYFYSANYSYGVQYYKNDHSCIGEDWESDNSEWATHGTNTSTTAAAPMNNGGTVGIAPDADILALKVDMSFVAIREAINYAVSKGADVINMSLGAYGESFVDGFGDENEGSPSVRTYLNSACNNAYNNGVILVAAAGNEATDHKSYPACNNHVIGVGALNRNSNTELAPFTNYNDSSAGEVNVDILAPGFVFTAGIDGSASASFNHTWHDTSGTSFSSPIVAGAAALWKEKIPDGTPDEFEECLKESAAGIGTYANKMIPVSKWGKYSNVGPSCFEGGRLDVGALMQLGRAVNGVTLSPSSLNLYTNTSPQALTATVKPATASNKNLIWSSSNSAVASVDQEGFVTPVSPGQATITVRTEEGNFTDTCEVTVNEYVAPTSIDVNNHSVNLEIGDKYIIDDVIWTPENVTEKVFFLESADESIAAVSESDNSITGVSEGITTFTVMAINDLTDDILETEIEVTVTKPSSTNVTFDFSDSSQRESANENQAIYSSSSILFQIDKHNSSTSVKQGADYSPIRLYQGSRITLRSSSYNIVSAIIECDSSSYANALKNGTWTGASVTVNDATVTVTPTTPINEISAVISAQTRIKNINLKVQTIPSIPVESISVTPSSSSLRIGEYVQLSASILPDNATDKSIR